jgi:O-succinylbenzoate synthase
MNFDCGLGTGSLLGANVADLPIIDGEIEIAGVEPDFNGIEVAPDRYEWWKNRVMKTAELL